MPRKSIIITATFDVLDGDDTDKDAQTLNSKVHEMLVDRDWLNQKNRNIEVSHIITNIPEHGPYGPDDF